LLEYVVGHNVEAAIVDYRSPHPVHHHLRGHIRKSPCAGALLVFVDPETMLAARKAGASAWALHERAFAGEFAPAKPFDPRTPL